MVKPHEVVHIVPSRLYCYTCCCFLCTQ